MGSKFFEELSRCLGKEQIESLSKEDRRLEIFLHGQPVLSVSPGNEVFMLPSGSKNPEANELYHRVAIAADRVFEYVEAMENTPLLRARGLDNKLCQAIQQLSTDEIKKLGAVVEYARPETAAQVRQLAENLEQFDYAPGVQNVEEYGRYMIQKSGRFEYDENLRDYYDYARYGLEHMNAEEGRVVKSGYVSYHGVLTLEDLMMDDPAEQYQRNQGFNFQMT